MKRFIEKLRTWRAYRHERRRAMRRAEIAARIMVASGALTLPSKR